MNTTHTKTTVKGATVQSEQVKSAKVFSMSTRDVILRKAILAERGYAVMPLDERPVNFFKSLVVAKAYAEDLAKQSFGKVIVRGDL